MEEPARCAIARTSILTRADAHNVEPQPGALDIIARCTVDPQSDPGSSLPGKLPNPNLCFRVKRVEGCFIAFPAPFPSSSAAASSTPTMVGRSCWMPYAESHWQEPPTILVRIPRGFRSTPLSGTRSPNRQPPTAKTWDTSSPDHYTIPVMEVVSHDRKHLVVLAMIRATG